jgi:O-antigen ligase
VDGTSKAAAALDHQLGLVGPRQRYPIGTLPSGVDKPSVRTRAAEEAGEGAGPYDPSVARSSLVEAALAASLAVVGVAGVVSGTQQPTAAALFAGGLLLGLRHPVAVPAAAVLALPFGFSVTLIGGVQVGLLDALLWGTAVGYASSLVHSRRLPDLTPPDIAVAAFVVAVGISGASAVGKGEWLHEVALWAALAAVFHCSIRALRASAGRHLFFVSLGITVAVEAIYAIEQFISAAGSRFSRLGGAIIFPQPQATLQHPNALGAFLVVAALLLAGKALGARGRARWSWVALAALASIGAIVPFSRGSWISFAAGAVVFLLLLDRRHRRAVGVVLATAAAAVVAVAVFDNGALGARLRSFGQVTSLNGFRATIAHRALHVIAAHPIEGAGRFVEAGIYAGRRTVATHPHDLFLGIGVFFGVPAMIAFAALLILCVRSAWRARTVGSASVAAEGAGALAAVAALLVDGFFEYPFWNTALTVETMLLLMLSAALGAAWQELDERRGQNEAECWSPEARPSYQPTKEDLAATRARPWRGDPRL